MVSRMTDSIRLTSIKGKKETGENLKKFFDDRKIPFEVILSYHCFVYKGNHYRVKSILEAKKAMGIPI